MVGRWRQERVVADTDIVWISYESVSRHLGQYKVPRNRWEDREVLERPCALPASEFAYLNIAAPVSSAGRWLEATQALEKTMAQVWAQRRPQGALARAHLVAAQGLEGTNAMTRIPFDMVRLENEIATAFRRFRDKTWDLAEHIGKEEARKEREAKQAAAEERRRAAERRSAVLAVAGTNPVWDYQVKSAVWYNPYGYLAAARRLTIRLRTDGPSGPRLILDGGR